MAGDANPLIQKYVKSITARNHSILALSNIYQPTAARLAYDLSAVSMNRHGFNRHLRVI